MNLSWFIYNTLTCVNLKQKRSQAVRAVVRQKRRILAALQERFGNILSTTASVKFPVLLDMRIKQLITGLKSLGIFTFV